MIEMNETAYPEGKPLTGKAMPLSEAFPPVDAPQPVDTEEGAEFRIDSESAAVWYCRKRKAIEDERAAIKAATAQRLEELAADERSLIARFEEQLKSWAMGEAEKRRRQTITLPLAGVALCFRTPKKGKLVPTNDGLALRRDIAQTLGFMTPERVIAPEPDLDAYAAYAEEQHEQDPEVILPGFEWKDPEPSFKIDFAPKKGKLEE